MDSDKTVGIITDWLNLTSAEKEVMERMNRGYYLIKLKENGEYLSINGTNKSLSIKAGTINRLLDCELIKYSVGKYLLTDLGRTYR